MKRLLACLLLFGPFVTAESIQSTLLALKDPHASRKTLSNQLVNEMMELAKSDQSPARATVQRFSEDLTTALIGKDVTTIRAAALQQEISDVLSGKGSTFIPASKLYDTLSGFRIEDRTIQQIVDRFREIGQEIRGPDDLPVRGKDRK